MEISEIYEKISEQNGDLHRAIGLLKVLYDVLLFASDNNSDAYYYYTCSEILLKNFSKISENMEYIEIGMFKLKTETVGVVGNMNPLLSRRGYGGVCQNLHFS